jgi:hypothetical protein
MLPTEEQIRQAAFDRWQRRGRVDGLDRDDWFRAQDELTFSLNYRTIVEHSLDSSGPTRSNDLRARYCRFCERTEPRTRFRAPGPLFTGGGAPAVCSEMICEECQSSLRDALENSYVQFWDGLTGDCGGRPDAVEHYCLGAFKGLVACALAIMPEAELPYFVDTLEWVSNPEPNRDGALLREQATCVAYAADFQRDQSWTSLARRVEKQALFPYMIFFLAHGGIVLQVPVPLCIRDQDLDGRPVRIPCRSFSTGEGERFEQAQQFELPILSKIPRLLFKWERAS